MNYFVDSNASGNGSGTSWANAWKSVAAIAGLKSGDTVFFSGGPAGSSKTYSLPSRWVIETPGVTFAIAREAGHNGIAIFSGSQWLSIRAANVVVSGDAGDGQRHFKLAGCAEALDCTHPSADNWEVGYVDMGQQLTTGVYFDANTGGNFHHNYGRLNSKADRFAYWQPTGSGYESNKFDDNVLELPNQNNGIGADGIQGNCSFTSFRRNRFIGVSGYSGGQHQDALQPLSGSYIWIEANEFVDIGNYPVFFDAYYGDFAHARIFNNLVRLTNSGVQAGSPQGIAIGPDGGALTGMGRWPKFDDVKVYNNTIADMGPANISIAMRLPGTTSATFTNCSVDHNLCINSTPPNLHSSVAGAATNVTLTAAEAAAQLTRYKNLGSDNDFTPKPGSTNLAGIGRQTGTPAPAPDPVPVPDPAPTPDPVPVPEPTPAPGGFAIGDWVVTTRKTNIRTTGKIAADTFLGTQPAGARAQVIAGPTVGQNTVWYAFDFEDGTDGWAGADNFALTTAPEPPAPPPEPAPDPTPAPAPDPQIAELQAQIAKLDDQLASLTAQLATEQATTADLRSQNNLLRTQTAALTAKIAAAQAALN